MEPQWKVIGSEPLSDAEAAEILQDFVKSASRARTPASTSNKSRKNIGKDLRKLSEAVKVMKDAQDAGKF